MKFIDCGKNMLNETFSILFTKDNGDDVYVDNISREEFKKMLEQGLSIL